MSKITFLESEVKMPLMMLPVRSPVVSIGDRHILISPGSQLQDDQYPVDLSVTDIVAPNLFHTAGIAKAKKRFPKSLLWGCKGADKKLPELKFDRILERDSWEFNEKLSLLNLQGMPGVNESVFVDRSSKSLIVTDLCFNITNATGLGARLILGSFGTYNKFGVSRLFGLGVRDKKAFQNSLNELLQQDFDHIIVSHGTNVQDGAKIKLKAALAERGFVI